MWDLLAKLVGVVKPTVGLFVSIFLFSLVLLLLPTNITDKIDLTNFIINYKQWIGIALIGSVIVIVVLVFNDLYKYIKGKIDYFNTRNDTIAYLQNLSENEKELLLAYTSQYTTVLYLPYGDEDAISLVRKSILSCNTKSNNANRGFHLEEWTLKYLCENSRLLD